MKTLNPVDIIVRAEFERTVDGGCRVYWPDGVVSEAAVESLVDDDEWLVAAYLTSFYTHGVRSADVADARREQRSCSLGPSNPGGSGRSARKAARHDTRRGQLRDPGPGRTALTTDETSSPDPPFPFRAAENGGTRAVSRPSPKDLKPPANSLEHTT